MAVTGKIVTAVTRTAVPFSAPRSPPMFRGFATLNLFADDIAAARDWYAELFGVEAYYAYPAESPAYVEFRIGDDADEIGIIDRRYAPQGASSGPGGVVMHW